MDNQLVVLCLAKELYGVGIAAVSEIIMLQPITYVPRAPAFVEGVTNLRGKVLPVIDLRKRFGLAQQPNTKETRIVVAEINHTLVGLIVDAVTQVLRVPAGAVEPPSPVVTTVDSAFISGIAKVGSQLIILLDLEKVLLPDEKADLQRVALEQKEALPPVGRLIPASRPPAAAEAAPTPTPPPKEPAPAAGVPAEPTAAANGGTVAVGSPAQPRKRARRKAAPPPEASAPDAGIPAGPAAVKSPAQPRKRARRKAASSTPPPTEPTPAEA